MSLINRLNLEMRRIIYPEDEELENFSDADRSEGDNFSLLRMFYANVRKIPTPLKIGSFSEVRYSSLLKNKVIGSEVYDALMTHKLKKGNVDAVIVPERTLNLLSGQKLVRSKLIPLKYFENYVELSLNGTGIKVYGLDDGHIPEKVRKRVSEIENQFELPMFLTSRKFWVPFAGVEAYEIGG